MEKIILDANFLMIPAQFRVDIFEELIRLGPFEIYVLDTIIGELSSLTTKGKGKDKAAAKLALQLIKAKDLKMITSEYKNISVDDSLVRYGEEKFLIATQDVELKHKLEDKNIPYITLRKKQYLVRK